MATFVNISHKDRLAKPAAQSYERMRARGLPAGGINSALRTNAEQRALFLANYQRSSSNAYKPLDRRVYQGKAYYRKRNGVAVSVPGSSNSRHENGLALDIATASSAQAWMLKNASKHGWHRPLWNAFKQEPWHWEYRKSHDKHFGESTGRFRDVHTNHKFYKEIEWLAKAGITNGYSDGTFRPLENVTREAMAAFLYRLEKRPAVKLPAKSPFKDVTAGSQFYKEIVWLAQSGITTGYANGTFKPKASINRDAMAAFLYRASGAKFTAPSKPSFKDVPKSAQFYREIEWLRAARITTGYADGTFRPYQPISREATAAFLHRF